MPKANPDSQHFRLLLVEDNAINQKVALAMLKNLGYRADVARNGAEAVKAVVSERYDLVLMDCLMPEMDGFEATRCIRAHGEYCAEVPIIAMTANAFAEDRDACLAVGMTDYLSKPVREAELRKKLERWLAVHESAAAGLQSLQCSNLV
jgi:two-component system sensor histidine kinase/response regulator